MKRVCIIFFGLFMGFLVSCATPPVDEAPEMYWPTPPAKARIKFVDYIIGSIDATGHRKDKFKNVLFGTPDETSFAKPSYVRARDNIMYVTDVNAIQIYDFKRKKFSHLQSSVFTSLTGLAVTSNHTIFVGDSMKRAVFVIPPNRRGVKQLEEPPEGFGTVGGIAVDQEHGLLYAADTKNHRIVVYNNEGKYLKSIGSRGVEPGKFNYPYDVAVDKDGVLAVLDSGNFRVQLFTPEGEFIRFFGTVGTVPGTFARPRGLTFDNDGHIFVADAAFANFQIFDYKGNVYLFVGKMGTSPGQFLLPMGIYIDEQDRVYVVDQANKRIQIFKYLKYPDEKEQISNKAVPPPQTP